MGILDNAADIVGKGFSIWEGYKKEMDRQQESKLNLWGKKAALWKSTNQGQPMPDSMLKDLYAATGVPMPQANQGPQQGQNGQPAQQGGIPGYPSAPGQQTQLSSSNLGQQAGGQAQQGQPQAQGRQSGPIEIPLYEKQYPEPPIELEMTPERQAKLEGLRQQAERANIGKQPQQSPLAAGLGQQAIAQPGQQQDVQPGTLGRPQAQRPRWPEKGYAVLNEQTGEQSPIRYIPTDVELVKAHATPKGITWMVDPTGKNKPVQTFEGDPRAQQLADAGYIPMQYDVQKTKQAQEEKKESNLDAYHQAKLAKGENKPEKPPKTEFDTFAHGVRARLEKEGITDEGTVDRTISDEWAARTGQKLNLAQDAKMKGINLEATANTVYEGRDSLDDVRNAFGVPITEKVRAMVEENHPGFNYAMNDANVKWYKSAPAMNSIAQVKTVQGRLNTLYTQVDALQNLDYPALNKISAFVSKQLGHPEYTNYESLRNAMVQEINTALTGSVASTDTRIHLELQNLQAAESPQQIKGALRNLNEAMVARISNIYDGPYPQEVVQGKKSIQEYYNEMNDKYLGNYKKVQGGGQGAAGAGTSQGISDAGKMAVGTIKTVNGVQYRKVEGGWQKIQQ